MAQLAAMLVLTVDGDYTVIGKLDLNAVGATTYRRDLGNAHILVNGTLELQRRHENADGGDYCLFTGRGAADIKRLYAPLDIKQHSLIS